MNLAQNSKKIISQEAQFWLNQKGYEFDNISKVSDGASFRKYFRLHRVKKRGVSLNKNLILLISPPEIEKNLEFVDIANRLKKMNIFSIRVIEQQKSKGFLLLNDLGNESLFSFYKKDNFQTDTLKYYLESLNILACIYKNPSQMIKNLNQFDAKLIETELNLFDEWFINQTLSQFDSSLLKDWQKIKSKIYPIISSNFLNQPSGFTHRDFHSKNLIITKLNNNKTVAVIDFQDALIAPVLYDLISLLNDSYIQLPMSILEILKQKSFEIYQSNFNDYNHFQESLLWISIQRQIKVVGIFSRLNLRDQKKNYLKSIPLTLYYLSENSKKLSEMTDFYNFINHRLVPLFFDYSIKNNLNL